MLQGSRKGAEPQGRTCTQLGPPLAAQPPGAKRSPSCWEGQRQPESNLPPSLPPGAHRANLPLAVMQRLTVEKEPSPRIFPNLKSSGRFFRGCCKDLAPALGSDTALLSMVRPCLLPQGAVPGGGLESAWLLTMDGDGQEQMTTLDWIGTASYCRGEEGDAQPASLALAGLRTPHSPGTWGISAHSRALLPRTRSLQHPPPLSLISGLLVGSQIALQGEACKMLSPRSPTEEAT